MTIEIFEIVNFISSEANQTEFYDWQCYRFNFVDLDKLISVFFVYFKPNTNTNTRTWLNVNRPLGHSCQRNDVCIGQLSKFESPYDSIFYFPFEALPTHTLSRTHTHIRNDWMKVLRKGEHQDRQCIRSANALLETKRASVSEKRSAAERRERAREVCIASNYRSKTIRTNDSSAAQIYTQMYEYTHMCIDIHFRKYEV